MKKSILTLAAILLSTTSIAAHAESVAERQRNEELRKTSDTTWSETKDKIEKKVDAAADKTEKALEKAKNKTKEAYNDVTGENDRTVTASAATGVSTPVTSQEFIQRAIYSNNYEVELSKELDDSDNDSVKEFAKKIIDDHKKSEDALEDAIEKSANKDVYEKIEPEDDLDAQQKAQIEKIKNVEKGPARDKLYVQHQVEAHKESVKLFREYSKNGDDAALKGYAQRTLPVLEAHLKHAEGLARNIQ
jgi:putative membrane protein